MTVSYLGIDVGTSAVKAVLVDQSQSILATGHAPLSILSPRPGWSEQDPNAWWAAVEHAVAQVRAKAAAAFSATQAIGLSGQMHGAVLLGPNDEVLCPAILWNDARAVREAEELHRHNPHLARPLGVLPMPGLTAPKILWLARHDPELFEAIDAVLSPKDFIRLRLTGNRATDMSDAAGTWWLDQGRRAWSDGALAATGLDEARMPRLLEGSEASGILNDVIARRWGLAQGVVVAGGAGDAAAGAVGLGAISDGDAFISLGTSAQFFVTTKDFRPAPDTLVHAFCHALPGRWYQMAAMLNGASCLAWIARILACEIPQLLDEVEASYGSPAPTLFLPYLAGERTPHNDPNAQGVLFGLTPQTTRAVMVQAVLEGVAFSLADARCCIERSGTKVERASLIGGGSRSILWARIVANAIDLPLALHAGGEHGPAFGAARLARLAVTGEAVEAVCAPQDPSAVIMPDPRLVAAYRPRIETFRRIYGALKHEFALMAQGGP